jgi:type VI secretion system protein VasG
MPPLKRSTLFGKLNSVAYKAIESATVFCKMRGNPYVETVHWLHQLLQSQDSDVRRIIKHFQLDVSRVAADLIAALPAVAQFAQGLGQPFVVAWNRA